MSSPTHIFEASTPSIGLRVRTPTEGPEQELVRAFLAHEQARAAKWRNRKLAIFVEPFIDGRSPDVIVAEYLPAFTTRWVPDRAALTVGDMKVMHHLWMTQGAATCDLTASLGLDRKAVEASVARLLVAKVAYVRGARVRLRPLSSIYGIKRLVAVEAKIFNLPKAATQAQLNRWFVSESYVLSNIASVEAGLVELLGSKGIGLLSVRDGRVREAIRPVQSSLPVSYASWLVNEWILRSLASD